MTGTAGHDAGFEAPSKLSRSRIILGDEWAPAFIAKDSWVWFTRVETVSRGKEGVLLHWVRCGACGRVMLPGSAERHAVAVHHAAEVRLP